MADAILLKTTLGYNLQNLVRVLNAPINLYHKLTQVISKRILEFTR